ncbi:MAG: cation:proton antiporter [Methanobacteriota archaeon]
MAGELEIPLQMSVLLAVSLVGYLVASRLGQSAVVGAILVGVVVGPSLLGVVEVEEGGLVEILAYIGAIVLLFVVGLESDFREIFRLRYAPVALLGVIVPWLGGFGVARLFGYPGAEAVFIGTALTATSIAITANVLREFGALDSGVAKAILGAAVLDDILGLLALGVTVQATTLGEVAAMDVVWLVAKAALFLVGGLFFGRKVVDPQLDRLYRQPARRVHPEFVFVSAMTLAFVYSALAEAIGLSGIVGAFIAGLSLDEPAERHGKSYREGAEYIQVVFAGIFFVSLGILVDLRGFDVGALGFVAVLTAVAFATKFFGCALPARAVGESWTASWAIGVGMVPRGEVAMIVGLLGLSAGVIGQEVYTAILLMALLTTVLTPPLLKPLVARVGQT